MTTKPDLLIIGQVTVDDVVPPTPGPWQRQMGGSSLYAAAGARLSLRPGPEPVAGAGAHRSGGASPQRLSVRHGVAAAQRRARAHRLAANSRGTLGGVADL